MIWSAILIPIVVSLIGYLFFNHKLTIVELLLSILGGVLAIIISYYSIKSVSLTDNEYNGYMIVEARYYEPWETYVHKTCSYTTTHSCGKNCTYTVTHYYDCSYCDEHPARYTLLDTGGNEFSISKEEYNSYVKLWNHKTPQFVELNRDIEYYGGCGKDGDMYRVNWNGRIENSVASTTEISFTNILKSNHSAFNYPNISQEQAKKLSLYEYPTINNYYQKSVLGLDSINLQNGKYLMNYVNYLNGTLGKQYKSKVFLLIFPNKDIDIAFKQEAYWDGGNRNEINVCVGTDKVGNIKWVKVFSWNKDKLLSVNLREDIVQQKSLNNVSPICNIIDSNIKTHYKWRDFEDFNYLSFQPTTKQLILIYSITLIISLIILFIGIRNDINPE